MSFLVLPKLTVNLPTATINATGWAIPNGVQLADPSFCVSKSVDIVLGIEAFFDFFVTGQKISLGEQTPALNESVFGWVVCGGLSAPNQSLQINCNLSMSDSLDALLTRFWDCEEIESVVNYSPEEVRCEALFAQTVQRGTDGRYTVSLPKDEEILARMGDSRDIAFQRLLGTERRLARNADLKEQYVSFMDEYCRLGHMKKVDINPHDTIKRCYLPHHPVVKEASTTTKVRVVFDASCKTSSGISLNDVLLVGPVIQEDLRSIIMRCRTKQIMIVADVEKMFRQIDVKQEERPLQCILWRPSPADDVATYELNTVTYGTKPAPFLATRTLKQLALDEEVRFPLAAQAAIKDTYMDDVLTGSDDVEEAIKLRIQLDEMMSSGGFRLRKWASNAAPVLDGIAEENLAIRDADGINLDPDPSVKTLGLTWLPNTDVFRFQFNIPTPDTVDGFSKRRILSIIATLFDPLGLIGATITTAKLFMQLLWTLRDEDGNRLDPPTVGENWRKFHLQLPLLNEIRINRSVILPGAVAIELHCFSDASEKAYGACIYIRSQDAEGKVAVRLFASKSRVAPLKCQTIPRLELCGALIAAQLYEKVQQSVRINSPVFFWTDSTYIINNESWWNGPSWLAEARDQWPQYPGDLNNEEEEEERRRTAIAAPASSVTEFNDWYIVRKAESPKADRLATYVGFGMTVQQLVDHLEATALKDHLVKPMLIQELVKKTTS
ncbi:uncharacterized protein LOC131686248 [Topomyia yanbarensis]|uniref:uncharacterized protein LOC131686248 n=1 Tax=Topomyia yanbarensis TaxID=2498891 RepID=UPI00273C86DC|nr:uncharacterized protein LOC131686248 [Topomyia yanbarensis]